MNRPAITPTVTHRVRGFLVRQGIDIKPWSGLDETYEKLYALLSSRKNDPAFWGPLRELLDAIVQTACDPEAGHLAGPQAEVLRAWQIDDIVQELRNTLPDGKPAPLTVFTSKLSAPVLGGFLILGIVTSGCHQSTSFVGDAGADGDPVADTVADTSVDSTTDPDLDVPEWALDCELDPTSVLYATIEGSELDEWAKADLCRCFWQLNSSWNDGLTELFTSSSPEAIASALDEMMECCVFEPYQLEGDMEDVRDEFLDGTLCWMALPYRGVSFPEK